MNLSRLWETTKERKEGLVYHGVTKSQAQLSKGTTTNCLTAVLISLTSAVIG